MARVIFVDIDGPMIPSFVYLKTGFASYHRTFAEGAVDCLNEFCERTSAMIVFNSFHNYQFTQRYLENGNLDSDNKSENIRMAAIRNGVKGGYIHDDWRTLYQHPDCTHKRIHAIREWLARHPETNDWVAIDDADFRDQADGKQILIDFDYGFTVKELNKALKMFNAKPLVVGI